MSLLKEGGQLSATVSFPFKFNDAVQHLKGIAVNALLGVPLRHEPRAFELSNHDSNRFICVSQGHTHVTGLFHNDLNLSGTFEGQIHLVRQFACHLLLNGFPALDSIKGQQNVKGAYVGSHVDPLLNSSMAPSSIPKTVGALVSVNSSCRPNVAKFFVGTATMIVGMPLVDAAGAAGGGSVCRVKKNC